MSKRKTLAPFDLETGRMLRWVPFGPGNEEAMVRRDEEGNEVYETSGIIGRYSYVFKRFEGVPMKLEYAGYARGQSAAYFWFEDKDTGLRYSMFMKELDELLRNGVNPHFIGGRFSAIRRGLNYGIRLDDAE